MGILRHQRVLRSFVLALLVVLVAGCSGGESATRERATEEVSALGDALADAVILSYEAGRGRAEPDAGTGALNEARALTLELSETSASLDGEALTLSLGLIELANQAIVWVGQSEYELAEKLRLEEFIPAAEQFNAALAAEADAVTVASAGWWSNGMAVAALAVVAIVGVFLAILYWGGEVPDPVVEARKRKAEQSGQSHEPIGRKWSDIPLLNERAPDDAPTEEGDAIRSPNARTIEVDLRALLMTALHQVKDYGWNMSIVCPEISIIADPVKLRQAVLGVLGHAFMGGAQQAGIVVEDIEGVVLLSIGRDTPPDQADAERAAEKFTNQVKLALGLDQVESQVMTDDDVMLFSVSLGRKVGAEEVSEPVV